MPGPFSEERTADMDVLELARRLAGLGQTQEAQNAYTLAIEGADPAGKLEAAAYIFQSGGDYRISYTCFRNLYNEGHYRKETFDIMTQAFYEPNVKALKKRYEKNCRLLAKYPYLFRKDFLPFQDLPIRFYPYDDNGYVPFFAAEERFGDYVNLKYPAVSRNFFKDLEKPILADGVTSQYELEYLNDNVRDSTRVGRENHVYLHYGDWGTFCAYLQLWNLRPLLEEKKFVFLIGDELALYPIDFKARFGIDYSQYQPQPVAIREVSRLIWHTQLSAHNGGDFFNEIFDGHPNLLALPSILFNEVEETVASIRRLLKESKSEAELLSGWNQGGRKRILELYRMGNPTDKDILAGIYLANKIAKSGLDQNSRIAPALFFQPHFEDIVYKLEGAEDGRVSIGAEAAKELRRCRFLKEFPYIKTFTPMRRMTTSYGGTVQYMYQMSKQMEAAEAADPKRKKTVVGDEISDRILNRSFMIDPEERLFQDSILVRFEDAKLNPKATFTALAAFLDLPYTPSMTECTQGGQPLSYGGYIAGGFDTAPVYKAYDEFAGGAERYYIEYFMRDAYARYGYDFHYYDGAPMDEARAKELIAGFTTLNGYIRETWKKVADSAAVLKKNGVPVPPEEMEQARRELVEKHIQELSETRLKIAKVLLRGPRLVNQAGRPLRFMPMLEPDPALLEAPLYH